MYRGLSEKRRLHYVGLAQTEVERLAEIVKRMLEFYRPSRGGVVPTAIEDVIENVLTLARKRLQHGNVRVHTLLASGLPDVGMVPDQITQVFLNVIINAIEAMPAGGDLWLDTMLSGDGRWLVTRFRDSGPGLSAEQRAKLFEPFATTKADGTGLGLAISYGIIERHRGKIEVSSQPGQGATFTIKLPTLLAESDTERTAASATR
jgi:two-component system NtrC family sensor kinase